MKFHFPSFALGVVTGASAATLAPRVKPLVLDLATAWYRLADAALLRVARGRETFSDVLAEAKARARDRLHGEPRVAAGA